MLSLDQDRYDHHGIVTRVVADMLWGGRRLTVVQE